MYIFLLVMVILKVGVLWWLAEKVVMCRVLMVVLGYNQTLHSLPDRRKHAFLLISWAQKILT